MIKFKIKLTTVSEISKFIKIVNSLDCDVDIIKGRYIIDAKSVMGVFSLDLSTPVDLYIHTTEDPYDYEQIFTNWIVK